MQPRGLVAASGYGSEMAATATKQLAAFLSREFPGMNLRPGGYGDWPHLRFELGDAVPLSAATERAAQAAQRGAAVFEVAFAASDDAFLSFTRWRPEDDEVFMQLLPEPVRQRVERHEGINFYDDDDRDATPYTTYTLSLKPRALNYPELFRLVANAELGESPSLDGRAYLVNRSRPLIFHMYDDRGAILFASDAQALAPVRQQFADWLVVRG